MAPPPPRLGYVHALLRDSHAFAIRLMQVMSIRLRALNNHFVKELDSFERASAEDKTLKSYPGMLHEPFHEVERALVLGDLRAWLSARL